MRCNLRGANLRDANPCDANLRGANLCDANLRGANLRGANLRGADLSPCANLRGANLCGANPCGADLCDANLCGADLRGAKSAPLIISGLRWVVQISGTGWMQIGCRRYSVAEWAGFDDDSITKMDTSDALLFWKAHKSMLMALCSNHKHPETESSEA